MWLKKGHQKKSRGIANEKCDGCSFRPGPAASARTNKTAPKAERVKRSTLPSLVHVAPTTINHTTRPGRSKHCTNCTHTHTHTVDFLLKRVGRDHLLTRSGTKNKSKDVKNGSVSPLVYLPSNTLACTARSGPARTRPGAVGNGSPSLRTYSLN